MKRILLCFYPLFVKYNHGISLLSSLCKERGIDVRLYVLDDVDRFDEFLSRSRFDFVGFSAVVKHDYIRSLPFILKAKERGNTVLLGGVYARYGVGDKPIADLVCRGDGELLPYFILSGDMTVFSSVNVCDDLNDLPLPDYELFRSIPFERGVPFLEGKKVLPYYSSRGCPHKCSFCQVRHQPKGVRLRTRVEEDLSFLSGRYEPDVFFMGDELLPYYSQCWRESWGDFRHPFCAYIRADATDDELSWMIDRGLMGCAFGIESGDEKYRNETLKKGLLDSDIYRVVEKLHKNGIPFVAFYMTHTPGETFFIRAKTFKAAERIGGYPVFWRYEPLKEGVF